MTSLKMFNSYEMLPLIFIEVDMILFKHNVLKMYLLNTHLSFHINSFKIYHVWEGYLQKIPVLRLNFPRHSAREIFRLSTGIFRKYPSQTS
jgi:hypothetical protein